MQYLYFFAFSIRIVSNQYDADDRVIIFVRFLEGGLMSELISLQFNIRFDFS